MAEWARAISEGLSQGFKAGAGLIDAEMRREEQIAAEERAADRKLQDAERLMAIQEAMKMRAYERFSGVARQKMEEGVPLTAEPVTRTTPEGAKAIGKKDGLINMTREQVEAYKNPEMLAQFDAQLAADNRLAQEKAAGKTRPRTYDEAIKAALEETSLTNPAAFLAGKSMFADDMKEKLEERKIASREKIEQGRLDQRDRREDRRFELEVASSAAALNLSKFQMQQLQEAAALQRDYQAAIDAGDDVAAAKIERKIAAGKQTNKKDAGDYLRAATQLIKEAPNAETPEESKEMKNMAALMFKMAGVDSPKAVGSNGAPYPDGTRLQKGGQIYVVKGGVPILESEAARTSVGKIK